MKTCAMLCVASVLTILGVGCTTVHERPAAEHTTVIEKQPVVTERQVDRTPDVQNNIHVDR